jgi:hypothetical protein
MEFHLDDVIGDGEGALGRRRVAKKSVDQNVVGDLLLHRGGIRGERVLDLRDPRQFPIVDRDLLGGVLSLQRGFRDDDCDRLADMAHPSDGISICGPIKIGRNYALDKVASLSSA